MGTIFHTGTYWRNSLFLLTLCLQLGQGSLAINMHAVVKEADLVVTGKFVDFADTDYFVLFEPVTIHKGELTSPYFVVYFSESLVYHLNDLRPDVHMFFILNSREDADLSARKKFDESSLCSLSLYVPAIEHVEFVVFNLTAQQEYLQYESKYYLWLAEAVALEKSDRWQKYKDSMQDSNWHISQEAYRAFADEVNEEIESLDAVEQRARRYTMILDTTNNRYMEHNALRFFSENQYGLALPVMLRRFANLPDSVHYMVRHYLGALRNNPDSSGARVLLQKIDDFEYPSRLWEFSQDMGEIIKLSLEKRQDTLFRQLLSRFMERAEDSTFARESLPKILPLFAPYTSAERTELLIELWKTTGNEIVFETMAAGAEVSALAFLKSIFVNNEYTSHKHILNALAYYTEQQVATLLIDFFKQSDDNFARNDVLNALSSVLAHTTSEPEPTTLQFIQERLDIVTEWDTRIREVERRLFGVLASSKSDKIAQMTMEEIERASDDKMRRALIRTLRGKRPSIVSDFLLNTIFNKKEADGVREAAVWAFAGCDDDRTLDALHEVAASELLDKRLRQSAINILMDSNNPSLATEPLIDLLKTFTTWQEYDELNRWIGFLNDLRSKNLTEKDRGDLDECLVNFYRKYLQDKPATERFDFLRTLRKRTDWYLPETFSVATTDQNPYIREEAHYALEESQQKALRLKQN